MEDVTYEVTVACGDDDDAPIPTETDIQEALVDGLNRRGLTVDGVSAVRQ